MNLTMAKLSGQLVAAEGIIMGHLSVHMTKKSFARSKPKGKGRKGKKKSFPKGQRVENGPISGVAKGNKGAGAKPNGKCFHCGRKGHWKQNLLNFLSKKKSTGMIESLVSEVSFATGTLKSWYLLQCN